eukprot:COSAG02_NODE_46118_length_351_cov_1.194444_2_plen_37_part_01
MIAFHDRVTDTLTLDAWIKVLLAISSAFDQQSIQWSL